MSKHSQHRQPHGQYDEDKAPADLKTMERNHFFYGKLLDVFHLEMEQEYFNAKRRIINRLVIGPGVVCGLDVEVTEDNKAIVVQPGFAIDRRGNEIIVPTTSRRVELTDMPEYQEAPKSQGYGGRHQSRQDLYCEIPYKHVVLCYHECKSDPTPVMAGDCETVTMCASGSIRELYTIELKDGFVEAPEVHPLKVTDGRIDYEDLVELVSHAGCRPLPDDGCIPLANIHLKDKGDRWKPEADISIRQIVYTNRLLFRAIQSLLSAGKKQYEENRD